MSANPRSSQPPQQKSPSIRASLPPDDLKVLGKYVIAKRLGAGGMGTVYLATDTQLKRTVALKVLPKEKAENATLVQRFRSEAQASAHLRHENIVMVYEAGSIEGHLYIALEYVDGIDVHMLVSRKGALPVNRSIDIVKQVCRALEHAHKQGIVHRDIKPSNLLITRAGTIKLADMGLARSVDDTSETNITRAGTTVGTVDYMAPEQARDSKSADIRSDIYSLGCTWFQMLTGRPPFPDGSLTNKLGAHASQAAPDPRQFNSEIPDGVVAVLHRMMAKSPRDRYQTPAEILTDLEEGNVTQEALANRILDALSEDSMPSSGSGEARRVSAKPSSGATQRGSNGSGSRRASGLGSNSRIRPKSGSSPRVAKRATNGKSSGTVRKAPLAGLSRSNLPQVDEEVKEYAIVGGGVAAIVVVVMILVALFDSLTGEEPAVPRSPFAFLEISEPPHRMLSSKAWDLPEEVGRGLCSADSDSGVWA